MEGDVSIRRNTDSRICHFNPLPPHGGRRATPIGFRRLLFISIHSLRMEGDIASHPDPEDSERYFNPLPPHGGRRDKMSSYIARKVFQSTPSAWRETDSESTHENEEQNFNPLPPHGGRPQFYLSSFSRGEISIHSLRMEGDRWHGTNTHCWSLHFNPLPPHGGRHGNR